MDAGSVMLLSQLVNGLEENFEEFKKAYDSSDKESFDISKKNLLDIQSKIAFILKQV